MTRRQPPIRPRRRRLASVACLALLLCRHAFAVPPDSASLRTAHYDLYVEKLDVEDVGRMLEAYHRELSKFFGAAPEGPLRVEIYSTRQQFESALTKDDLGIVKAGGFYSLKNRKAYLWVQPSDYFTRQLILHECAHQFHYLAACGGQSTRLPMYAEGLAEHLAMHDWDGRTLKIGIVPDITLEDYPVLSLRNFRGPIDRDLEGMVTGRVGVRHAESWAVVHFLIGRYPEKFAEWSAALNHQADPAQAWRQAFGEVTPALVEEFEAWTSEHAQPWEIESVAWQQWGDAIEGKASDNHVAVALLKETPASLAVAVEPLDRPVRAGLVFGRAARGEYSLLQLGNDRRVELLQRSEGRWHSRGTWQLPPVAGGGPDVLSLRIDGGAVALGANGKPLQTVQAPGRVGLHIQQGRALFRRQ